MQAAAGMKRLPPLALAAALLLTACGGQSQPASGTPAPIPWKHGIIVPKGDAGFELMAREKGYYKAHGVDVEFQQFAGNVQLNQALIAGVIDSGEESADPAFSADLKGGTLKIIGSTIPGNPFGVLARAGINSFSDLKGKTIGVSQPGALPDVLMRAMLKAKGVDPNSVTAVNAGADAERYNAVKGGKIDAAAVSSEFVPMSKKDGINLLGLANDVVPLYPRFVIVANGDALKSRPDGAVRFLAGEMEGLRYALSHRQEELQLTSRTINLPVDDPRITYLYDAIKDGNMVAPNCDIPRAKIEWLQNLRVDLGIQKSKVDLNTLIDDSFRQKALKLARASPA